jgi:hypothetical protein
MAGVFLIREAAPFWSTRVRSPVRLIRVMSVTAMIRQDCFCHPNLGSNRVK